MPEMKGITVKIPADLHAEVKAYLEAHGMTMGEFIAQAVDNELHPKIQITQEDKNMGTYENPGLPSAGQSVSACESLLGAKPHDTEAIRHRPNRVGN